MNPPEGYPRISPYLNYEDTGAMIEWLTTAFDMRERHALRGSDGRVVHAEMTLEDSVVMMGSPGGKFQNPRNLGRITQSLYVYIDDVDAHHDRVRAAGGEIIEAPADQDYGDRRYGVRDPEGHQWFFASRRDASNAAG
jgi:uncharacterized glyoxalase superfamily protein PhnB